MSPSPDPRPLQATAGSDDHAAWPGQPEVAAFPWPGGHGDDGTQGSELQLTNAPCTPARAAPPEATDDSALQQLMARIVAQEERALALLYDHASARVYGLALRIVRRPALAEEVVEDTFWQAWRQAPRFDPARGRVLTWLLTIARSRAIDLLRRDADFLRTLSTDELVLELVFDEGPDAHERIDAERVAQRVNQALLVLEPQARQLVALAFFRALTHEEIARHTGLPLGTVKSMIRRALQLLRRHLAPSFAAVAPAP